MDAIVGSGSGMARQAQALEIYSIEVALLGQRAGTMYGKRPLKIIATQGTNK